MSHLKKKDELAKRNKSDSRLIRYHVQEVLKTSITNETS